MNAYQEALEQKVKTHGEIIRWLIAMAVSMGALLEVIDTSIVNVALPHIQGNLGATFTEVGWVITAYAIANGIMIPLSAWLGTVFGTKRYFILSMIGFTLASLICGVASNLPMLVFARLLQGLFGGGLLAKAQSILFQSFPKEQQGHAQGLFGVCVIVGPIIGPTLGGYLTDMYDWRWIFFINLPIGILASFLCFLALPPDIHTRKPAGASAATGTAPGSDPAAHAAQPERSGVGAEAARAPKPPERINVDWLGITLLVLAVGPFQYLLEQGQQDDWFSSPLIVFCAVVSFVSLILFIVQELNTKNPAVNLHVLRHRSIAGGSLLSLVMGMTMYGTMFSIPAFVQTLLGFTAMQAGLLLLPGSIASGVLMPLAGVFAKKGDARVLVAVGTITMAWVMFQLTAINIQTGVDFFWWPLIVRGVAMILIYMPMTMATLGSCPPNEIAAASGFFNLARQLGGSIGVAAITTILEQRNEFHRQVLIEKVTPFNPAAMDAMKSFAGIFLHQGASGQDAMSGARMVANANVLTQASVMSFEDISWLVGVLLCTTLPLLFLLDSGRKTKAVAAH
jgi:DHA2 family multidrug resistance protein